MEELSARSETIEQRAWQELYREAPEPLRRELGLQAEERDGVTCLSASRVDHLLLNRAIGLGSGAESPDEATASTIRHYQERGIARYWVHLGSQHRYSELPRHLGTHGVVPYPRSWMKFARRAAPVNPVECALRIRPARPDDATRIGEIVAPSFDLPLSTGALFCTRMRSEGWHYFVAEAAGKVAAASALYVRGPDALLVFAATAPEARRQGCQRAFMAARLEQSQRLGCDYAFTETGVPVQDEVGSSYRNILRAGFDELYVRDNFAPEGTRWDNRTSSDEQRRSAASAKRSKTPPKAAALSGS